MDGSTLVTTYGMIHDFDAPLASIISIECISSAYRKKKLVWKSHWVKYWKPAKKQIWVSSFSLVYSWNVK